MMCSYSAKPGANAKFPKHSSPLVNSSVIFLDQVSFESLAKYQDSKASLLKGYAKVSAFHEQLTRAIIRPQEVRRSHACFATFHEQAKIHFLYMVDQEGGETVL